MGEKIMSESENLIRVCGNCQVQLTPKNTGDLKWLQPNCNDCTDPKELKKEIDYLVEKHNERLREWNGL